MNRRQFLTYCGGGLAAVGASKAIDNTLIGYGDIVGTNLTEQDYSSISNQPFPQPNIIKMNAVERVVHTDHLLKLTVNNTVHSFPYNTTLNPSDIPNELTEQQTNALLETHADYTDLYDSNFEFEAYTVSDFFTVVSDKDLHALTVSGLRGRDIAAIQPDIIEEFTGVTPTKPKKLLKGLATALREKTYYDIPRYVAGSVQDNILFGTIDLREPFRSDVSFNSLNSTNSKTGMFCYEFTWRSIEALHSVPAFQQDVPVFAATVLDRRHKHVYTVIGSVYRDTETHKLKIPLTFVDYTHVVLYDDLHARGILGNGLNAYNDRHRATNIWWTLP